MFRRRAQFCVGRDLAKDEAQRLSEKYKKHGENASTIPPGIADDAVKALEILGGLSGVSLCEAARFYKKHHDTRRSGPLLEYPTTAGQAPIPSHRHQVKMGRSEEARHWQTDEFIGDLRIALDLMRHRVSSCHVAESRITKPFMLTWSS